MSERRNLVIVESPVKKRTIAGMLGPSYFVFATGGHFRCLFDRTPYQEPPGKEAAPGPDVQKSDYKDVARQIKEYLSEHPRVGDDDPLSPETNPPRYLGVDFDKDYEPAYLLKKPSMIAFLQDFVSKMRAGTSVYLATDPDREGEGIAYHLWDTLVDFAAEGVEFKRMVFYSVTKGEVEKAIQDAEPTIDDGLVSAYQTREIIDQTIGYAASRALWGVNIGRNALSVGRVQMAGLEVLMREEEQAMQALPKLAYEGKMKIGKAAQDVTLVVKPLLAEKALDLLKNKSGTVRSFTSKKEDKWAFPPYTLSAYQSDAKHRLNLGAREALSVAQYLFEKGAISYPRTDSASLTWGAYNDLKDAVSGMGLKFLNKPPSYKSRNPNAQEAHEAIRPKKGKLFTLFVKYLKANSKSDFATFAKGKIDGYSNENLKAFDLIFRRTLAACLQPVKVQTTTISIAHEALEEPLKIESVKIIQSSWDKIVKPHWRDNIVPNWKRGQNVRLELQNLKETNLTASRPYADSLVVKLDEKGIGRPSTIASVIDTLRKRGYVSHGLSKFGALITAICRDVFSNVLNLETTATMDAELNNLTINSNKAEHVLDHFLVPFFDKLPDAREQIAAINEGLKGVYTKNVLERLQGLPTIKMKGGEKLAQILSEKIPEQWEVYGSAAYADLGNMFAVVVPADKGYYVRVYPFYVSHGYDCTGMISFKTKDPQKIADNISSIAACYEKASENVRFAEACAMFTECLSRLSNPDLTGSFPAMGVVEESDWPVVSRFLLD